MLRTEKELSSGFSTDQKFSFEDRNGKITRQYSSAFSKAYDERLNGMIERRMRQSIYAIACFWYTAWVDAGQPDLTTLIHKTFSEADLKEFEQLNRAWRSGEMKGRKEE